MSPPPEDAILTVIRGQDRRVSDTMIPQDTACAIHSGLVCGSSSTRPSGCRIKRPHCLDVWPEAKTARSDLVHVVQARCSPRTISRAPSIESGDNSVSGGTIRCQFIIIASLASSR